MYRDRTHSLYLGVVPAILSIYALIGREPIMKKTLTMLLATLVATLAFSAKAEISFGDTYSYSEARHSDGWAEYELEKSGFFIIYTGRSGQSPSKLSQFALFEVKGANSKAEIKPVVENLGFNGSLTVSVWTDEELRKKAMPPLSTKSEWELEWEHWVDLRDADDLSGPDGYYWDTFDFPSGETDSMGEPKYEYESETSKVEYEWPRMLWPNDTANAGRFWVAVELTPSASKRWYGFEGSVRVWQKESDVKSELFYIGYDTCDAWPCNTDASLLFRGFTINTKFVALDPSIWNVEMISYNTPLHSYWMETSASHIGAPLSITLPEAGILYLSCIWYPDIEEDITVKGADGETSEDFSYGYDDAWQKYDSMGHDSFFYEYGTHPYGWPGYRAITVNSKKTITLEREDVDDDFDFFRLQFYPKSKKAVAVEASFASIFDRNRYPRHNGLTGYYFQGYVTGTGVYKVDETVKLTAIPAPGEAFDHWELKYGNFPSSIDTTKTTLSFKVTDAMAGTAEERKQMVVRAVWKKKYEVIATVDDITKGTVTGSGFYLDGATATLTANATPGWDFKDWSDGVTTATRKVTVNGDMELTANFVISVKPVGTVSLQAKPAKDMVFAGWYTDAAFSEPASSELLGADYRTASVTYDIYNENPVSLYPRMVSKTEDANIAIETDSVYDIPETGVVDIDVARAVNSYTKPTIKVTGLPKGATFNATTGKITGTVSDPGLYEITVTASNQSTGNNPATTTFTISVPNLPWRLDRSAEMPGGFWTLTSPDGSWQFYCAPTHEYDERFAVWLGDDDMHWNDGGYNQNPEIAITSEYQYLEDPNGVFWTEEHSSYEVEDFTNGKQVTAYIKGSGVLVLSTAAVDPVTGEKFAVGVGEWSLEGWEAKTAAITKMIIPAEYDRAYGIGNSLKLSQGYEVEEGNTVYYAKDGVLYRYADARPYHDSSTGDTGDELMQFPTAKTGSFTIPNGVTKVRSGAFEMATLSNLTIGPDLVTFNGNHEAKIQAVTIVDNERFICENGILADSYGTRAVLALWPQMAGKDVVIPSTIETIAPGVMAYGSAKSVKCISQRFTIHDNAFEELTLSGYLDFSEVGELHIQGRLCDDLNIPRILLPVNTSFEEGYWSGGGNGVLDLGNEAIKSVDIIWPTDQSQANSGLYYINFEDKPASVKATLHVRADAGDWPSILGDATVKKDIYTVEFNDGESAVAYRYVIDKETVGALPSDPLRAGYKFDGWYDPDGKKVASSTKVTGDTVYTAHWSAMVQPVVMPGCEGMGTVSGGGVTAQGKTTTLTAKANKGYVFAGWYDDSQMPLSGGSADYRFDSYSYAATGEAVQLFARFIPIDEDYVRVNDRYASTVYLSKDDAVGDVISADMIKEYIESVSKPTVTVSGLPAGLRFDANTLLISGKVTDAKEKWYDLIVTVKNASGYTYTGIFGVSVNDGMPDEYDEIGSVVGVNFSVLDDLMVGHDDYDWELPIPSTMKVAVKNLPTGLYLEREEQMWQYDYMSVMCDSVLGTPTKSGVYYVEFTGSYDGMKLATKKRVVIRDCGSIYVEAVSSDPTAGTVTGTGIYAGGSALKLTAKANRNYVFAYWLDNEGTKVVSEDIDYRQPSYSEIVGDSTPDTFTAVFVPAAQDQNVSITPYRKSGESYGNDDIVVPMADDEEWTLSDTAMWEKLYIKVESVSLPTVTVAKLPSGLSFTGADSIDVNPVDYSGSYEQFYRIKVTDKTKFSPGKYDFTITAKNVSGKTATRTITLKVGNYRSDNLDLLYDDAYVLTPGGTFDMENMLPGVDLTGWTVTGLPTGMTFKNGSITGAPTQPDKSYTVWFKKGNDVATVTMRTSSLPPLTVSVLVMDEMMMPVMDEELLKKFKVTGAGTYAIGKTATLTATAPAGWVFAGWLDSAMMPVNNGKQDYRTASSYSYVMPETATSEMGVALVAQFVKSTLDDSISIMSPENMLLAANADVGDLLMFTVQSHSLPTVTAVGMPAGVTFDAKALKFTGKPTKPGEAATIKITAKNQTNKAGATASIAVKIGDATTALLPGLRHNDANAYASFVPGKTQDMVAVLGADTMAVLAQGGWTVTGLPAGMTFNSVTGTFSGAPTTANTSYLVTFKKGSEMATITLNTGATPPLTVGVMAMDETMAPVMDEELLKKFKVTGAGSYAVGKTATLGATAPAGWVFSGWLDSAMMPVDNGKQDYRTASSYSYVMPETATSEMGVTLIAQFIPVSMDYARVADMQAPISLMKGDAAPADILKNAIYSGSKPTVTVSGLPAGIRFDANTLLLAGTATDATAKWYDLKVTVKNASGYAYTGIFGVSVNGGMPAVDVDELGLGAQLTWLDMLRVGNIVLDDSCFGTSNEGVTGVTGLPTEMTIFKETEGGVTKYLVAEVNNQMPVIKTPGVYTITVNGNVNGKAAKTTKRFVIRDSESIYERVFVADGCENMGTVTGDGKVVHPGETFAINATAKANYLFAGWYADPACTQRAYFVPEVADYRKASQSGTVSIDTMHPDFGISVAPVALNPTTWYAKFVEKGSDTLISINDLLNPTGMPYDFSMLAMGSEIQLKIESDTLPTITFKDFPTWMDKDDHMYFDGFWLWYNGKSEPNPGEYTFTMTAKNVGGATIDKRFTIRVPNYVNSSLPLDYANGYTLVPGAIFSLPVSVDLTGWTVTGLPTGMTFNSATGTFSGAPTQPDKSYTVWFKKSGQQTATVTMRTKPYPELVLEAEIIDPNIMYPSISVDIPAVSQFKLTGAGNYQAGKTVTLGATAPKGWVFAGWRDEAGMAFGMGPFPGLDANSNDTRVAAYKLTMPEQDTTTLKGVFIHESMDSLMTSYISSVPQYVLTNGRDAGEDLMVLTCLRTMFLPSGGMYGSFPTVTSTTLPAGMKLDANNLLISGKITAPAGFYYVTFTAKNASGYTLSVPVRFIVNKEGEMPLVEDPTEVDTITATGNNVYFSFLQDVVGPQAFVVGHPVNNLMYDATGYASMMPSDGWFIGTGWTSSGVTTGITGVSGLPTGMKLGTYSYTETTGYSMKNYYAEGLPTVAGWVNFTVDGKDYDYTSGSVVSVKYMRHLPVYDTPSKYIVLKVAEVGGGSGTVTGGGVWNSGKAYDIKATAAAGSVFAGWYTDPMCTMPLQNWTLDTEGDYRYAAQKLTTASINQFMPETVTTMPVALYAKFIPSGSDSTISINVNPTLITEPKINFSQFSDGFPLLLNIQSESIPTLTFTDLPTWISKDDMLYPYGFLLHYNYKSEPDPGEYSFTVTAKNASGAQVSRKFTIAVSNYVNPMLPLDYVNGYTLVPGATFSLPVAVDLTGWTVTGLPTGMTFNSATGTFSGAPTQPDKSYTVWFKKSGEETATVTMRTKPYPELVLEAEIIDPGIMYPSLSVDIPAASQFKLTGAGNYQAGKTVTLGATAPKGWVFAGWRDEAGMAFGMGPFPGLDANSNDTRVAAYKLTMPEQDTTTLKGVFIHESMDSLMTSYISSVPQYVLTNGRDAGEDLMVLTCLRTMFLPGGGMYGSFPTVTSTTLPAGMKFDANNLLISGKITAPAGFYYVTFTAKNASGYALTVPVRFIVENEGTPLSEDPTEVDTITQTGETYDYSFLQYLESVPFFKVDYPVANLFESGNWGYMIPEDDWEIGYGYTSGGMTYGITAVSGLPDGIKSGKDGHEFYGEGFPSAAGWAFLNVTGKSYDYSTETPSAINVQFKRHIPVFDTLSRYVILNVSEVGGGSGTVTGGGVWNSGKIYEVKATAAAGSTFAGWFTDPMCSIPAQNWTLNNENDYRATAQKWSVASIIQYMPSAPNGMPVELFAKFVPTSSVEAPTIEMFPTETDSQNPQVMPVPCVPMGSLETGDLVFEIQPTDYTTSSTIHAFPAFAFRVASEGLPTVTVSGLPKSAEFEGPYADGLYSIDWDGSGAFPDPGDYPVTITMKNAGGTTTASFTIRINGYPTYDTTELGMVNAYDLDVGIAFDDWNEAMGVGYLTAGSMDYDDWSQSWSWTVTGLPAGMSFNATTGKISGTPSVVTEPKTYAVHFKKTYKYSGSSSGSSTYTTEAIIPFTVSPLPSWVVGTFTGYTEGKYWNDRYGTTHFVDSATIIISKDAKLTLKSTHLSTSWDSQKIVTYTYGTGIMPSYRDEEGGFVYEWNIKSGREDSYNKVVVKPVDYYTDGLVQYGEIEYLGSGLDGDGDNFEESGILTQSLYDRKPAVDGLFSWTGQRTIYLTELEDYELSNIPGVITLTFGKNGAVTPTFKENVNGKVVTGLIVAQPVSVENIIYLEIWSKTWLCEYKLAVEVDDEGNVVDVSRMEGGYN